MYPCSLNIKLTFKGGWMLLHSLVRFASDPPNVAALVTPGKGFLPTCFREAITGLMNVIFISRGRGGDA